MSDSDYSDVEILELLSDSSSESNSEFESDQENIIIALNIPKTPRTKVFFKRKHPLVEFDDCDFEKRFRFPKIIVSQIADMVYDKLSYLDKRNNPIPIIDQVILSLSYYATGSFQIVTGDLLGVHQVTCGKIVKKVSIALAQLSQTLIKLPSNHNDINQIKLNFYEKYSFPNLIGIIDCTHIPIQSPGGDRAETFRCRKSWFSINTQCVCDANCKITDINARWPGSTVDQTIFNFSKLRARLEGGEFNNGYLIGDSGYGNKNYLLTLVSYPKTSAEIAYNKKLISVRQTIERCFGMWKRRFPILSLKIRNDITFTLTIIIATAVLHNIAIENNLEEPQINNDVVLPNLEQPDDNNVIGQSNNFTDNDVRSALINAYFT